MFDSLEKAASRVERPQWLRGLILAGWTVWFVAMVIGISGSFFMVVYAASEWLAGH